MSTSPQQSFQLDLDNDKRSYRNIRAKSVDIVFQHGSHASGARAVRFMDGIRVSSQAPIVKTKEKKVIDDSALVIEKSPVIFPDPKDGIDALDRLEEEKRKRMFLKMAGVVGLGTAAGLLLPKKAEALVFGSTPASNVVGVKDASNARINPAKEDGNLASIKTNTDGLAASGGGGYVRQDSTATIAKESGGNLASIKTNTDTFAASGGGGYVRQDSTGTIAKEVGGNLEAIKTNTDKFTFDLSGNLLTAGASESAVGVVDADDVRVNPATDDAVVYLRRMVKLMESQATVDAGNRQRITIDSLGTGTAVTTTIPVSGTVTATVSSAAITTLAGQNQQMYQDVARNAYANGIRQNLIFT